MAISLRIPAVWLLCLASLGWAAPDPARWVPARWDGGPLEAARRGKLEAKLQDAIARWYEPATLELLENTPINCLLVTFSAGLASDIELSQHQLVRDYAQSARKRGVAVLGIVYPGGAPSAVAAAAIDAKLDGLLLDGDFPPDFAPKLSQVFPGIVISVARDAAAVRASSAALLAVQGVRPSARDLADMGIRAGASAEPWIDSNIWLVRSLRVRPEWRPIWISQEPNPVSEGDYVRCVADAAIAGGRWMVSLDDELRVRLFHKDADALGIWRRIAGYLKFAEDHADWRSFAPYGNTGIVIDDSGESEEYLNLIARRQVPYRLIPRKELSAGLLSSFKAAISPGAPNETERRILSDFAAKGGVVVAGPAWGGARKDDPYTELSVGQGRIVIYKDDPPDPESLAKDLADLLPPETLGLSAFNVASAITYASTSGDGRRALIQVLNYAGRPIDRATLRFNGVFLQARFYTPESAPIDLAPEETKNGRTEVLIPRLTAWGAVLLEQRK